MSLSCNAGKVQTVEEQKAIEKRARIMTLVNQLAFNSQAASCKTCMFQDECEWGNEGCPEISIGNVVIGRVGWKRKRDLEAKAK